MKSKIKGKQVNKIFLYLLLTILTSDNIFASTSSPTNSQQLAVPEAIQIAFQKRPSLRKIDFDILASKNIARASLAGYLPHIEVHTGAGTASWDTLFAPRHDVEVNIFQLLYNFAGPLQEYQIAKQDVAALKWQHSHERDIIRFETEQAILHLWDEQKRRPFIEQLDISSHAVLDMDIHKKEVGLLNLSLFYRSLANYAETQASIKRYPDEIDIAKTSIGRSIGIDNWNLIGLNDSSVALFINRAIANVPHLNKDHCFDAALTCRKELMINAEMLQKELYQQRFFERSYIPTLGLYFRLLHYSYKVSEQQEETLIGAILDTGWRLGFQFDWRFDGLANVFNASAAEDQYYALTMERLDLIDKIKREVYDSHSQMNISYKWFKAEKARLAYAHNEFILRKEEHRVGMISDVQLEEAEAQWQQAKASFTHRKAQVAKRQSELLYACGYPDEGSLITMEQDNEC